MASKRELEILLTMRDNMAKQLKKSETQSKKTFQQMKTGFAGMNSSMNRSAAGIDKLNARMKKFGANASNVKRTMVGLLAGFTAFTALRSSIKTISDFEYRMAELQGVTRAQEVTMAKFTETARRLGATTRYSATQAAEGLVFLARAGFDANAALDALPATLNLATAGNISLGQAADYASNIVSQFNLAASETVRVVDTMVATANRSNTNVLQLAEALKYTGSIAGALNQSVEGTSAAIGVLGDRGIQATLAGTGLRGVFAALLAPSDKFKKSIAEMNVDMKKLDPTTNSIVEIFEELKRGNMTASDAVAMFGRRQAAAALIFADSTDKMRALTKANEESRGEAERFAATMRDTIQGAALNLKSAFEELVIVGGDRGLQGTMRTLLDTMAGSVRILAGVKGAWQNASTASIRLAFGIRAMTTAFIVFMGLKVAASIWGIVAALRGATIATKGFTAALVSNPLGAVAVAISLVVGALYEFWGASKQVETGLQDLGEEMDKMKQRAESMNKIEARWLLAMESNDPEKQVDALRGKIRLLEEALVSFQAEANSGAVSIKWTQAFKDTFQGAEFMIDEFRGDLQNKIEEAFFKVGFSSSFKEFKKNIADVKMPDFVNAKSWTKMRTELNDFVTAHFAAFKELPIALDKLVSSGIRKIKIDSIPIKLGMELDKKLIEQFKSELGEAEDALKKLGKSAQQRVTDATARISQRKSLEGYISSLRTERKLIGLVGLDREFMIGTLKAEAKATKLSGAERHAYIEMIHDEIQKVFGLREAWKKLQEQQKQQARAIANLSDFLTGLKEENRLLRIKNTQGEVAYRIEKALTLAKLAKHNATAEEIADVRALLVENEKLLEQGRQIKSDEKRERKISSKEFAEPKSFAEGWKQQIESMNDHGKALGALGDSAAQGLYQSFDQFFFQNMDTGFKDLEKVFENFIKNVLRQLMAMASSEFSRLLLSGVSSGLGSLFSGSKSAPTGKGFESFVGPTPGHVGSKHQAHGGAWDQNGFVKLQHGGAFTSGQSITHMRQGGAIIDKPTISPLPHGGRAMLGEQKPEGVFPLVRDSMGDYAIKAVGGGGGSNIHEENNFTYAPNFPNVKDGPGVRRALDGDKSAMHAEFQRMMTTNRAANRRMRNLHKGGA